MRVSKLIDYLHRQSAVLKRLNRLATREYPHEAGPVHPTLRCIVLR